MARVAVRMTSLALAAVLAPRACAAKPDSTGSLGGVPPAPPALGRHRQAARRRRPASPTPILPDGRSAVPPDEGSTSGAATVTFDLIDFLTGDAARRRERGEPGSRRGRRPPNDYFIRDDNRSSHAARSPTRLSSVVDQLTWTARPQDDPRSTAPPPTSCPSSPEPVRHRLLPGTRSGFTVVNGVRHAQLEEPVPAVARRHVVATRSSGRRGATPAGPSRQCHRDDGEDTRRCPFEGAVAAPSGSQPVRARFHSRRSG